ncbi:hypothetical protein ACFX13_044173 [Malus domestica]
MAVPGIEGGELNRRRGIKLLLAAEVVSDAHGGESTLEHHGSEHHPQGVKEAFQEQNQGGGNGDWQPRFGSHPSSSIRYEFEPFLHVLVMIYKKGFAYDNTKLKYDRTLYDLKKLKDSSEGLRRPYME